jgi:hypothetical protein
MRSVRNLIFTGGWATVRTDGAGGRGRLAGAASPVRSPIAWRRWRRALDLGTYDFHVTLPSRMLDARYTTIQRASMQSGYADVRTAIEAHYGRGGALLRCTLQRCASTTGPDGNS